MDAWTEVIAAAALKPWLALAPGLGLAALRWLGLLLWLPSPEGGGVSVRMRIMLALLLAVVSLPAAAAYQTSAQGASTGTALPWLAAGIGELALGSVIGLGVRVVFSALVLAGELIDQQAGLALQQVFNPLSQNEGGPSGAVLAWLAVPIVLMLGTTGGDLAFLDAVLRLFQTIPIGAAVAERLGTTILLSVVQQSLFLTVQVAAPVLAAMSLVTMGVGWLGRTTPQLQLGPLVAPLRVGLCVAVLAASLPGTAEQIAQQFDVLIGTPVEQRLSPKTVSIPSD